jgi:hypothetical protein
LIVQRSILLIVGGAQWARPYDVENIHPLLGEALTARWFTPVSMIKPPLLQPKPEG